MTRFVVYILFCLLFSLAHSDPIKHNDCEKSNKVVDLNALELHNEQNDMKQNEHFLVKKSTSVRCLHSKEDGSANCLEDSRDNDISQEYVPSENSAEDLYQPLPYYTDPRFQDGYSNLSPIMNIAAWELPNQMSYVPNEAISINSHNYGAANPYVYQHFYGTVNSLPPIKYLPPVHSTYIHGINQPKTVQNYNVDLPFYFPPTVRSGRLPRRNDDLMDQLSHDSILNNFIPTMPVPFVGDFDRSSLYQVPDESGSPTFAVYPSAALSDCVRPILVSCSPKLTRGVIGQNMPPYTASAPPAHVVYRHPISMEYHKQQESHVAQHDKKHTAKSLSKKDTSTVNETK